MTTLQYEGRILTPVHIGTGETIDPLDYVIAGDQLVRYSLQEVLDDLPDPERARLEGMLDQGDLQGIHAFIRNHVVPERHALARMTASPGVVRAFERNIGRPRSQLKVHPMVRNLHRGRAYIPGSSIKGAIRTAVVSHWINREPQKSRFERELRAIGGDEKRRATRLQELALGYAFKNLEQDPFRAVKVSDAELGPGDTRVDEVFNVKPDRQQDMPVDMWERVWSAADGRDVRFRVTIRIDDHLFGHRDAGRHIGRRLVWDEIAEACNLFHWENMKYEFNRFFGDNNLLKSLMYKPFLTAGEGGRYTAKRPRAPALLLRLGRFGHFESKSVDAFRLGYDIKRRTDIKQGSTRNLVPLQIKISEGSARIHVPFGWVLFTPRQERGSG